MFLNLEVDSVEDALYVPAGHFPYCPPGPETAHFRGGLWPAFVKWSAGCGAGLSCFWCLPLVDEAGVEVWAGFVI